jgi:hypothetical protein
MRPILPALAPLGRFQNKMDVQSAFSMHLPEYVPVDLQLKAIRSKPIQHDPADLGKALEVWNGSINEHSTAYDLVWSQPEYAQHSVEASEGYGFYIIDKEEEVPTGTLKGGVVMMNQSAVQGAVNNDTGKTYDVYPVKIHQGDKVIPHPRYPNVMKIDIAPDNKIVMTAEAADNDPQWKPIATQISRKA